MNCDSCKKGLKITPTTVIVTDYMHKVVGYQCKKCFNAMVRNQ